MLNIKKMLVMLAETLYDVTAVKTGTLTAKNGFTLSEVVVRQVGRVVHIKGCGTKSDGIGTAQIELAKISGVSAPVSLTRTLVGLGSQAYSAEYSAYASITTDGSIVLRSLNHGTATVVDFAFTYVA